MHKRVEMKIFVAVMALSGLLVALAEPWTVSSSVPEQVERYSPPVLANGDIGMLVDYRNCQFQDVPAYKSIHAIGVPYFPATCRQGRRTAGKKLMTFGRIEEEVWVDGQCREPASWSQHLDIVGAQSICKNAYGDDAAVDSVAFVAQGRPVIAVRKSFRGPVDRYVFKWVFRRPGLSGKPPSESTFTIKPGVITFRIDRGEKKVKGKYPDQTIEGTVSVSCDSAAAVSGVRDGDTLTYSLEKPQGDVAFFVAFNDSLDGDAGLVGNGLEWALLKAEHEKGWRDFWGDTYVNLPDKELERTYVTALYNLKCWSTKWAVPIGILPTHWQGAIFGFGFNAAAFAAAGHLPEAEKLGRFWRSIYPTAKWRAGSNVKGRDVDSGIRFVWEAAEDGSELCSGGRFLDHHFHQSTIPADCWNTYLYSGDVDYLRDVAYPVIKGCTQYFQQWLVQETRDGRTIIGPVCDLERLPCPARNAFLTTCGAIYDFEIAAKAADILGVDRDKVGEWRRLADALRRDLPKKDGRYQPFEGCEQISVGTLGGLFPYGVLPLEDKEQVAAVEFFDKNGIVMGNMYNVGTRICTWYAAWTANAFARLRRGEDAVRNLRLANQSVGFFNEIFEINEPAYRSCPWCQAPQATFIQTVHEMLLQCKDDEIRIAPAVPEGWKDFSFRLRAHDDLVVEANCRNGKIEHRLIPGPKNSGRRKKVIAREN